MDIKTTLKSLMMLGIVAALVGGATYAVFSDTETSEGNQMVAGTIDMAVDGQNPWTDTTWSANLGDMKPCEPQSGEFTITNVGLNPMRIWKMIGNYRVDGNILTEPEEVAEGNTPKDNLAPVTDYQMTILTTDTITHNGELRTIIGADPLVTLTNVKDQYVLLGVLYPQGTMLVTQTYHLDSDAGNEYQGDKLTFDVTLYGEQIVGSGDMNPPGAIFTPTPQ